MEQVIMSPELLKGIVKESIKEALKEERLSLFLAMIPSVSDKEMHEIETICGKPADYDNSEFADISEWLQ